MRLAADNAKRMVAKSFYHDTLRSHHGSSVETRFRNAVHLGTECMDNAKDDEWEFSNCAVQSKLSKYFQKQRMMQNFIDATVRTSFLHKRSFIKKLRI